MAMSLGLFLTILVQIILYATTKKQFQLKHTIIITLIGALTIPFIIFMISNAIFMTIHFY